MLEALSTLLGFATGARAATTSSGVGSEPMPPYLVIATWPDGLQAVRVLDLQFFWDRLDSDIGTSGAELLDRHPGLFETGEAAVFMIGMVQRGRFDAFTGFMTREVYLEGGPRHQIVELFIPRNKPLFPPDYLKIRSAGAMIDPGDIEPRIAWFILDVLDHGNAFPGTIPGHPWSGERIRLRLPAPVPDALLQSASYPGHRAYLDAIVQWQAIARMEAPPKEQREARDAHKQDYLLALRNLRSVVNKWFHSELDKVHGGLFKYISNVGSSARNRTVRRVNVADQVFYLDMHLLHTGARVQWALRWAPQNTDRFKSVDFPPPNSTDDPLQAFIDQRVLWPESTYEAMLDDWLVPGSETFGVSSIYLALGAGLPYLFPPDQMWEWVQNLRSQGLIG